MSFEDVVKKLDPEIYQRFKVAIELGKWPDGRVLTSEQKKLCLQAVMLFESEHQVPEQERVGYVDTSKKKARQDRGIDDDISPIRVLH